MGQEGLRYWVMNLASARVNGLVRLNTRLKEAETARYAVLPVYPGRASPLFGADQRTHPEASRRNNGPL
jgi:hypothetical protein